MTAFHDIPIKDIDYLLRYYNQDLNGNKYLTAWNLLIQSNDLLVPKSIAKWIETYNNISLINQFNSLPDEIIVKLLMELDTDSLIYFCSSNVKNNTLCDKYIRDIYLDRLSEITKLDLTKYSTKDLLKIYRSGYLENNKVVINIDKAYVVKNNRLKVYSKIKETLPEILNHTKVSKIVSGEDKSLYILYENGELFLLTKVQNLSYATEIKDIPKFRDISHGKYHMLGLTDDGYVYGKDQNSLSQLGYSEQNFYYNDFVEIPNLENIVQISCGEFHSLALNKNGKVFSFGNGNKGALGYKAHFQHPPQKIPNLSNIVKISAGANHSLCLDSSGNVYAFGDNEMGAIGIVNGPRIIYNPTLVINNIVDILAGHNRSFFLTKEGTVYVCGFLYSTLLQIEERPRNIFYTKPIKILTSENTIKILSSHMIIGLIKNDTEIYMLDFERTNDILTIEDYYKLEKQGTTCRVS